MRRSRARFAAFAVATGLPSMATVLAHQRRDARAKTHALRCLPVADRAWARTGGLRLPVGLSVEPRRHGRISFHSGSIGSGLSRIDSPRLR